MTTAAKKLEWIKTQLEAGRTVYFATYGRVIACKLKHIAMIKVAGDSIYVQRGKNWDCHDYSKLTAR